MSGYHVYSQLYGDWSIKNSSFFVFSVDGSKKAVTIWAKYLSATEWSCLTVLENAVDYRYGLLGSELPLARRDLWK